MSLGNLVKGFFSGSFLQSVRICWAGLIILNVATDFIDKWWGALTVNVATDSLNKWWVPPAVNGATDFPNEWPAPPIAGNVTVNLGFGAAGDIIFVSFLCALMIADWHRILGVFLYLKRNFRLIAKEAIEVASYLYKGAILVVFVSIIAVWGHKYIGYAILFLMVFVGAFFGLMMIWMIFSYTVRASYEYYQDHRAYRGRVITNLMPRQEIAIIFTVLKTKYWRMALIRKLVEQRTVATGNWPEDFKLSVSGGPALTELAKLEERWLKLDR